MRTFLIDTDTASDDAVAILMALAAPDVRVAALTTVAGNVGLEQATRNALYTAEIAGSDVPVFKGAAAPLVRRHEDAFWFHGRDGFGDRGYPTPRRAAERENAVDALVRLAHAEPGLTLVTLGPLTNIALALAIDPHFAELTQGIVIMGGSINPQTSDPEFATNPRHEFNFWFDPEAAHVTLRAHWPRIDVTPVDVSVKAPFTKEMLDQIAQSSNPAARYIAAWSQDRYYLWDEFTACSWLNPSLVTGERVLYMDVDLSHGPSYGDTLTWTAPMKPDTGVQLVHAQMDLDLPKFTNMFVGLMKAPTSK